MTREEFQRKAADGSLTVGELRENQQLATPDLLAVLNPPFFADVRRQAEAHHANIDKMLAAALAAVLMVRDLAEGESAADALNTWDAFDPDGKTTTR